MAFDTAIAGFILKLFNSDGFKFEKMPTVFQ